MKRYSLLLIFIAFNLLVNCSRNSSNNNPDEEVVIPKVLDKTPNLRNIGDSANDILSNDNFTQLRQNRISFLKNNNLY